MKDQPDCPHKDDCRSVSAAREKTRIAFLTIEIICIVCVIIVMVLVWEGP